MQIYIVYANQMTQWGVILNSDVKCYLKFFNIQAFLMLILTKTSKQTKNNKITITNVTLS